MSEQEKHKLPPSVRSSSSTIYLIYRKTTMPKVASLLWSVGKLCVQVWFLWIWLQEADEANDAGDAKEGETSEALQQPTDAAAASEQKVTKEAAKEPVIEEDILVNGWLYYDSFGKRQVLAFCTICFSLCERDLSLLWKCRNGKWRAIFLGMSRWKGLMTKHGPPLLRSHY